MIEAVIRTQKLELDDEVAKNYSEDSQTNKEAALSSGYCCCILLDHTEMANGIYPWCEWKVFREECDALFKSKHIGDREASGGGGGSIDCDRLEETCTPLLSVWGFSQCPCKSTFTALPLESPQMAIKQSSLAQIACGNPMAGPNAINRSFIACPQETNTRRRNDMRERDEAELSPVPQLSVGRKNPVRLYLGTVHVLFRAVPN